MSTSAPIDPRLLRYAPAAKRYVAVTALTGVITAAAVIVGAVMIATILSRLVGEPGARSLAAQQTHLLVLAAAFTVRVAATVIHERYAHRASTAVIEQLRRAAIEAVTDPTRTSPRALTRMRGDLMTVLAGGLDALAPYLTSFVPSLLLSVTVTPTVIVVMAFTDLTSAIIVVVTLPLIPIFMVLIGMMTRERTRARLEATHRQAAQMLDLVAGIGTLRALYRADEPADRVAALGQRSRRTTMGALKVAFLSGAVLELLATLCVAVVAVGIGLRLVFGDMALHAGILALILAPEVYLPLRSVGAQFHNSEAGRAAADDVLAVIDGAGPLIAPLPHAAIERKVSEGTAGERRGVTVHLDDMGVVDRDGWAPRHLTARCDAGAVTVLTGANGAGKSTTLQAIAGLLAPDEGTVDVDGRRDIAWLAEPPLILPGSVAENLALFGCRSGPDVLDAAHAVGFDTVIADLPDGLDTVIGTGGAGLSAGQRQRLAITRVLCSPASFLLLDEPTAHLDADAEHRVITALRARAEAGATVVMVSHRPAVLAEADVVVEVSGVAVGVSTRV